MTTTSELDEPIDGRTARAVRTRDAIVDACLGLIDAGDLRPTGPRIAERAGVSVRSVFQHFDDLDALFAAVGARVGQRLAELIEWIDPAAPLEDKVRSFVQQRCQVLEAVTPVLRAALVHAASSVVIKRQFENGHSFFRAQVAEVFGPEIAAAPDPEALRRALVSGTSWTTWDLLRTVEAPDLEAATASVRWMVDAALLAAGASR